MHDGMLKMDEQAKSILNVNLQLFKKMHFWLRILFNGRKYDSIAGLSNR
jgi:hypothetical protein